MAVSIGARNHLGLLISQSTRYSKSGESLLNGGGNRLYYPTLNLTVNKDFNLDFAPQSSEQLLPGLSIWWLAVPPQELDKRIYKPGLSDLVQLNSRTLGGAYKSISSVNYSARDIASQDRSRQAV